MSKSTQKIKDVNMARQKQMMQEKARKEREEAKRQLLLGVEASGG